MDEQALAAIEQRANAATPGPWQAWDMVSKHDTHHITTAARGRHPAVANISPRHNVRHCRRGIADIAVGNPKEDADFVAHAREDIPALVAEVRRLQAENHALRLAHNEPG